MENLILKIAERLYNIDNKCCGNWAWELKYQPDLVQSYKFKAEVVLKAIKEDYKLIDKTNTEI